MKQDTETLREPVDTQEDMTELNALFNFSSPDLGQLESCLKIQDACLEAARVITAHVPEGRERNIAVNNILSAVLMANHGLTKRRIALVSCAPVSNDSDEKPPAAGI